MSKNLLDGNLMKGLDYFFKARSVAVVGASTRPGKIGHEILRSLVEGEYRGKVYPVNPKADEILDLKCYKSVSEIPAEVDLAVLSIPPRAVPGVIEDCGEKDVKAIVIVSGGFKEVGPEGEELERKSVEIARKYGIRIIGPNCIGVFDGDSRLDTFFQSRERMMRPPKGNIAFLTQSGTFGCAFLEWAAEDGIGISKFVSYGNRADVNEADLIRYLGQDQETRVIAIYTESISHGRSFMEACLEVSRIKPIVVLKSGRTEQGSRAAVSHTGSMAGSYEVVSAAFKQCGAIEVKTFEELYDVSKALSMLPFAAGPRIAMVTNGAGPCVMAVDEIVQRGMYLAEYSEKTRKELRKRLPSYAIVGNPVDLTGSATMKDYEISMQLLLEDMEVDILMLFFVFQDTPLEDEIVEVVRDMKEYGKPILAVACGGPYTKKQSKELQKRGIPVFSSPERAVAAAHALYVAAKHMCR